MRIVILALFCLTLTFWNLDSREEGEQVTLRPGEPYFLVWTNHSLSITTNNDDSRPTDVPARIAPFYFQKFNINQADASLLQIIPGIGPQLASRIIAERNKNGTFANSEQLLDITGIGRKRKELLMEWIIIE